ncbi:acyltransferase [Flavobacterium sediminilitoris]|uniref:Acyltransferase n=1 Tax=Flavobacterium sediminilitoris TaxID=2024526 RepID=A0ABY4HL37_9FLAO|nr:MULTISPECIES: acyltransferase [Flavobacterium]UOX33569.1 acyltransferase [Flavobacterium sediminilitoris]
MKELPNLTQLRFFLALFVLLFHLPEYCINRGFPFYNELPLFFKGKEAVLVFFSLSGFLIIRGLIIEKEKNGFINLKRFYFRRILRIFPLYYLILCFGFIFYQVIAPHFGYNIQNDYNLTFGILLGATFFANVLATYKPGGIIEILWSIGIEEQFYLFVAPILYKVRIKWILGFLIVFTIIYFLLFHSNFENLSFLKKYSMYFYHFSFSGIIACLSLKFKMNLHYSFKIIVLSIFCLLFFSNIFVDYFISPMYNLFCMIFFSIAIWILSLKGIAVFNHNFLHHLGKISYGIYMYHAVMFQLIGFLYLKFNITTLISANQSILLFYSTVIIFTIIISHFSYKHFESYFIKLKKH